MIPQKNLSSLSNRLAQMGGRRIPETILERDYCLSWFLIGLSKSPLKNKLLFKGGTAIKKCYIADYRFSEDIDFTLVEELAFEDIKKGLDVTYEQTHKTSGIKLKFDHQDRHSHQNSYTFFIAYEGPLPGTSNNKIKIDITLREKIVFQTEEKPVIKEYSEYSDVPDDSNICVYSLSEIAAEKVIALMDLARNEPRDLYDVWYLTENKYVDVSELIDAINHKLEFRNKKLINIKNEFSRKEARLRKLWDMRLSMQMTTLPEFEGVYRAVRREFRRAKLLI